MPLGRLGTVYYNYKIITHKETPAYGRQVPEKKKFGYLIFSKLYSTANTPVVFNFNRFPFLE